VKWTPAFDAALKGLVVKAAREPSILKPLLAVCNIAGRALDRDLGLKNIDTYVTKLVEKQALVTAGYIKPFLPLFSNFQRWPISTEWNISTRKFERARGGGSKKYWKP
jgi:hypothetical protein